jgi:uncharacterized protein (UPF0548 family)
MTELSYAEVGATSPASAEWQRPAGFATYERVVLLGTGEELWKAVADDVLDWAVKTRSGFAIEPADGGATRARRDVDYTLLARVGPATIREPARVVAVVDRPDRVGFAYGTGVGHPVTGEEAFVVHRTVDGCVWLTLRSITRPGAGVWRIAWPAVLVAQRIYRRRYARALLRPGT